MTKNISCLILCILVQFLSFTCYSQSCVASFKDTIIKNTVTFNNTTTGNPTKWVWDFGDNSATSPLKNPQHTYSASGNYNVCLTAYDTINCYNKACVFINVLPACQVSPNFTNTLISDGFLNFKDLSSNYGYVKLNRWSWDFGDGSKSAFQNPNHSFKTPGRYTVCLTVSDSAATCWAKACQPILVAPSWTSSKSFGGKGEDVGNSITTDLNGNVYFTGNFKSSAITFGNFTLVNKDTSTTDVFIVKQNAAGTIVWAKSAGSGKNDVGNGITCDLNGNVLVTGGYTDSITFGNTTLKNTGSYLVKYDSTGNVLWAKNSKYSFGNSVKTGLNGDVFITGGFFFVTKYDANGNLIWTNTAIPEIYYQGGFPYGGQAVGNSIATDNMNNLYITGSFECSLSFDSIKFSSSNCCYPGCGGGSNPFVIKYNNKGNVVWIKEISGGFKSSSFGYGLVTDNKGSPIVTGFIGNRFGINFVFVAKYNSMGNRGPGSSNFDLGNAILNKNEIAIDYSGATYVTGNYFGNSLKTYISKIDTSGNYLWNKTVDWGAANSITVDPNKNIYILGSYTNSTITFDKTLTNARGNTSDIFIAKIGCSGASAATLTVSPPGPISLCDGDSITLRTTIKNPEWNNGVLNMDNKIKTSGTYFVYADSAGGCSAVSKPVQVVFNPSLPTITSKGKKLFANCFGVTYQWYLNGTLIKDSVSAFLTVNKNGQYSVKVASNGCSYTSEVYNVVLTGVSDPRQAPWNYTVFPNPGNGMITIQADPLNAVHEDCKIIIFDFLGRSWLSLDNKGGNTINVNIASLPPGVYLLKVSADKNKRETIVKWLKSE
jgi:PKD repeat protein